MEDQPSSSETTGMDPRLAGLLSYLVPPITGIIFFLIEKRDQVVRWHAAQSIVFGIVWIVIWVALSVVSMIPVLGWILWIVSIPLFIVGFILWVICLIKGYSGQMWRMPVLAPYADRIYAPNSAAGGSPV